jgi:hypothetical protein
MCAQPTATDMPNAGLNIAELADQYTRLVRGIGHQYRLTPIRTGWRKSVERQNLLQAVRLARPAAVDSQGDDVGRV